MKYQQSYTSGEQSLTPEQAEKVVQSTERMRDKVLLELTLETGMRRSDVARQRWDWYNLDQGYVVFPEKKKGDTPHKAYLSESLCHTLRMYRGHEDTNNIYLFSGGCDKKYGQGHISGRTCWNILNRACEKAGIKPTPFHALRATAIKLMQKKGMPIEVAAKQVNDKVETVRNHYTTPSDAEMQEHFS